MNTSKNYIGAVYASDGSKLKDLHFEASELDAMQLAHSEFDNHFKAAKRVLNENNTIIISSSEGFVKVIGFGSTVDPIHIKVK